MKTENEQTDTAPVTREQFWERIAAIDAVIPSQVRLRNIIVSNIANAHARQSEFDVTRCVGEMVVALDKATQRLTREAVGDGRSSRIKHELLCSLLSKLAHPDAWPAIADDDDARALWAQVGKLYRVGADLGIYPKESP